VIFFISPQDGLLNIIIVYGIFWQMPEHNIWAAPIKESLFNTSLTRATIGNSKFAIGWLQVGDFSGWRAGRIMAVAHS